MNKDSKYILEIIDFNKWAEKQNWLCKRIVIFQDKSGTSGWITPFGIDVTVDFDSEGYVISSDAYIHNTGNKGV
jgi:hypothetical protein